MGRVAGRCGEPSHQEAPGIFREPVHRLHRIGMAGIDVGEGQRHHRLTEPFGVLCREVGAGFSPSREEAVGVLGQVEQERGRSGLSIVLFAGCDHSVSGGGDPVLHAGVLA